ncbi:MAG: hypothetical protein A07HN63_00270 [uncultured archaeon A07HN63]|nr:MAG: hypothetical protein A07HN63_00270 [uncultured archaeon A07HN63]
MTPPGSHNPAVYRELRDVLRRQPEITETWYEPDAVQQRYLAASIAPDRVDPPTGPDAPRIEVRWQAGPQTRFRIDYADPNTGFHCGWHRDDDHPDLGETHFQYERPDDAPIHEAVDLSATTPPKCLWACLDELFSLRLPQLTSE